MSVIASDRSNSAYSYDDSGSGVSHISEELFQKQMGETEFKPPLDLEKLFLKIQARVPGKCVEVTQALTTYYSSSQIVDIMCDNEKLLTVVNYILEDLEAEGSDNVLNNVEQPLKQTSPRSPRSERYRVCNPLDAPISNPVQNVSKISSIPMTMGQQTHFLFPQSNVQNPVYYCHPQQPVYKVVYPQYYYVAQPQIQPQYVYRTQPVFPTNQVYHGGYGHPQRYC